MILSMILLSSGSDSEWDISKSDCPSLGWRVRGVCIAYTVL